MEAITFIEITDDELIAFIKDQEKIQIKQGKWNQEM